MRTIIDKQVLESMIDERETAARLWAAAQLGLENNQWTSVSGDASFRRYFRIQQNQQSWIVMDAPPAQEDCGPFIDIAGRLAEAGLHAPQIVARNLHQGYLLLEDLGDQLYRELINPHTADELFLALFPSLKQMIYGVRTAGLPVYDVQKLNEELNLLPDWYLQHHLQAPFTAHEQSQWEALCALLVDSALQQPQGFVHRDYHSCNLLRTDTNNPGIIDFQDAVIGPISYDLVSLLWDRYVTWPREQIEHWLQQAQELFGIEMSLLDWLRCCDWMALQRNLKIVGIFSRLTYRDGKSGYLQLLPRFADYAIQTLLRYPELQPYVPLLEARLCAR